MPWPFLKGDSPNKAQLHPRMAAHFGFLYHRCAGLHRLETALISLRVCLFTQRVVIFSQSARPSSAFQGRRAITPNESSFPAHVPLRMFKSVPEF